MLVAPVLCVTLDSTVEGGAEIAVLTEGMDGLACGLDFFAFHTRIVQCLTLAITSDLRFGLLGDDRIMLMKKRVDSVSTNMIVRVQKQLTLIHPPKYVPVRTCRFVAVPDHGPLLPLTLTPLISGGVPVQLPGSHAV